ncbi:MAG TPA: hypothetical protein ENH26_01525 [Candidatus Wolfebacteria bacterium]|nr:hypothetical protein [Candidatus Wolfebacteria bacterium]
MTKFGKILIFGVIVTTLVAAVFLVWFLNTTKKITTYEECIKAGWLVRSRSIADSLPLFLNKYECVLWSGKSFEKYEEKQAVPALVPQNMLITDKEESDNEPSVAKALEGEKIKKIISDAVNWLKQSQESNGHFRYEYSPVSDTYLMGDLTVRQTGALYVLGEILRKDKDNKYNLKNTVENALAYFKKNSETGEFNGYQFNCILRSQGKCSLGAVSLGLVGALDLIKVYPKLENTYKDTIADYLNFILAMKNPDEGFKWLYYLEEEQPKTESAFSNGEALLALVRYYKYNPTKEVKVVIDNAFSYFNTKYSNAWDYNFYLWGMSAIKDLYKIEPKKEYFEFTKAYTDWRISSYRDRRDSIGNKCAYIEGVISAYSVLEPNITKKEKDYYLEEINFWLAKSKELQVKDGVITLRFGDKDYDLNLPRPERAQGGFLTGLDKLSQRIDFTQHCLSSYLQKQVDIDKKSL